MPLSVYNIGTADTKLQKIAANSERSERCLKNEKKLTLKANLMVGKNLILLFQLLIFFLVKKIEPLKSFKNFFEKYSFKLGYRLILKIEMFQ